MKTFPLGIAALALAACGTETAGEADDPTVGITATVGMDDGGSADDVSDETADDGPSNSDNTPDGDAGEDDADDGEPVQTRFDVGAGGNYFCQFKDPGTYCESNHAVVCGDNGDVVSDTSCVPDICEEGVGCVECLVGQVTCMGPNVMTCNAAANPSAWAISEVCDPTMGQGCDAALGTCTNLVPVGGTDPTGVYFQYADFATTGVFQGGYDVDSFENRLYVNRGSSIDVYEVELLDSDADGVFEPNQHPLNPDDLGPIEERVLTLIEAIPWPTNLTLSQAELYANDLGIWGGGQNITEQLFAGGGSTVITTPPAWANNLFALIGFDDVNEVWYAGNESARRVFQYDAANDAWGIAFYYPELAGSHMDGLEVVTQPETGIPFVYVSDMTSDFIGQYRLDPNLGWVQENLFEYEGTANTAVEGMGFGALNHFWVTTGGALTEVGGGDLAEFTEPPG